MAPILDVRNHWLHMTPKLFVDAYNAAKKTSCTTLYLHLYIVADPDPSKVLHISAPRSPILPRWSKSVKGLQEEGHIIDHVLGLFRDQIAAERISGLQFVDFAFERPVMRVEGERLDLCILIWTGVCSLDDAWAVSMGTNWTGVQWLEVSGVEGQDQLTLDSHERFRGYGIGTMRSLVAEEQLAVILRCAGVSIREEEIRRSAKQKGAKMECVLIVGTPRPEGNLRRFDLLAIDAQTLEEIFLIPGHIQLEWAVVASAVKHTGLDVDRAAQHAVGYIDRRGGGAKVVINTDMASLATNVFFRRDGRGLTGWLRAPNGFTVSSWAKPEQYAGRDGLTWL